MLLQALHERHPKGMCVMHTHQTHTAAICALQDPSIMMIHQNSCRFYKVTSSILAYIPLISLKWILIWLGLQKLCCSTACGKHLDLK